MGKKKKRLTEGKRNIIASLIDEYDIQSAEDIGVASAKCGFYTLSKIKPVFPMVVAILVFH
ncbi:MAG: hypothetical protein RR942_15820 [Romboutsia sp.]